MIKYLLPLAILLISNASYSQSWKTLSQDLSVNFYDVCAAAELHFDTIDITIKGSGYKGFQRWKNDNEYKYYPSGDRSNVDPYFVEHQFEEFVENNPNSKSLFQNGWEELGPTSPGQITDHYGFGMGRLETFYVDPNNTQRIYIGSLTGGFWKSLDGGLTWTGGTTDFLPATGVNTMSVSPTNSDSILINVNNSQNLTSHGIYRSVDAGNNWTQSNFNPSNLGWGGLGSNSQIHTIKHHPTNSQLIFLATSEGLYRSDDDLSTWTTPIAAIAFHDVHFHPTNSNIVYAYSKDTPGEVYISSDAGTTFTSTVISASVSFPGAIDVSPDCPNCVYFLTYGGYWKSTDNGASFSQVSAPNEDPLGFTVNDLNDSIILAGVVDAYVSTNNGLSFSKKTEWNLSNSNGTGGDLQSIYATSTNYIHADIRNADCLNGVFYAVTDGFLVNSTDNGNNWNILSEELGIRMNYKLGVSQSNHSRTICGSQDNGVSINTENGWVEMYGADGMDGIIHPLNDDWMIGSIQTAIMRRTFDAGQTTFPITQSVQNATFNAPLFYDPNNHMHIYCFAINVYKSEDFGMSWTNIGSPFSNPNRVHQAATAHTNSSIMAATHNEDIALSQDGGASWTSIQGSLPSYIITDLTFDPQNDSTIIVTYGRYQNDNEKVFVTHDLGASWQNITYNLGDIPIRSVVIDHTNSSTIYLGTEIGVYQKSMTDISWSLYNPDLPNTSVRELEVMWGSNTLRASTWGRGLWEYSLDGRVDFPAITETNISDVPTEWTPKETVDQYVSSTILYDSQITDAYVEWSTTAPTFGNVIPMSNTSGNNWVSSSPLPDFPSGTQLFFKVFAVGSNADTTETHKFEYTVKPNGYCAASGITQTQNLHISNVNISTINNTTANDLYSYQGNEVVELSTGNTYSLSLTGTSTNPNNSSTYDFAAWIDFNDNNSFDPNEEIMYQMDAGSSIATATFTVPYTAVLEDTLRLRVRLGNYSTFMPFGACGTLAGEVEDYPVWITCGAYNIIDTQSACNSFTWTDGNTYTSSNSTATQSLTSVNGCDSLVTLDLTINSPSSGTDIVSACESYTWIDGVSYNASTTGPTYTLTSSVGCDSIVTLDLTINSANSGPTQIVSACDSYTWIDGITYSVSTNTPTWALTNASGCDSIISLDLTIENSITNPALDVQSCGDYVSPGGNTWNSVGLYFDTLQAMNGCDSILPINLTMENIDLTISSIADALTSSQSNAQYQWINCLDNSPVTGATSQTFIPTTSGDFAVIVTYLNCVDTSSCLPSTVGVNDLLQLDDFKVYPNPTNGSFNIEFSKEHSCLSIEISNSIGQIISKEDFLATSMIQSAIDGDAGLYLIRVIADNGSAVIPLIKE